MPMPTQKIYIAGQWRNAEGIETFRAMNPNTGEPLPDEYPVSGWSDCDAELTAAADAFIALQTMGADAIATFLNRYAEEIESRAAAIVQMAHAETALPAET